jgi:hypothetical protein
MPPVFSNDIGAARTDVFRGGEEASNTCKTACRCSFIVVCWGWDIISFYEIIIQLIKL